MYHHVILQILLIGEKGAKKALAKVAKGALKNERKLWFCKLSDKGIAGTLIIFNHSRIAKVALTRNSKM